MIWLVAMVAVSPQAGLFSQVVPHPTGKNGYEEYVQAAVLASHPDLDRWEQPTPPFAPGLSSNTTRLQRSQWVQSRLKTAFELVRQGNAKPVAEPREIIDFGTPLPEIAYFRRISRALSSAAYADFAVGKTDLGTERLLDGLVFGENVSRTGTLLNHLIGISQMNMTFVAFESRLPQLSKPDCRRIIESTTALLGRPAAYVSVLGTERRLAIAAFDDIVSGKKKWLDASEYRGIAKELQERSPSERAEVLRLGVQMIDDRFGPLFQAFKGPESGWPIEAVASPPIELSTPPTTPDALAEAIVDSLVPQSSQGAQASLRMRAQLRLLRLHAWVLAFRWEYDRLPARLAEAVPEEALIDPANGTPFEYIVTETGYRLVSAGRPGIGEISLRYQRPPELPGKVDPPGRR